MSYQAIALKVMIASPADVEAERRIIRDVIHEWNAIHAEARGLVLMPVGWETHSSPVMGDRPQAIINKQVLADCDLLVAAFWTRLGTPTGEAPSGTVEEIEKHLATGKPAMLYFSAMPVQPDSVDPKQYAALKKFRDQCRTRGLVETYESLSEFREKFARQLAQTIIKAFPPTTGEDVPEHQLHTRRDDRPGLSEQALELLLEATKDQSGLVTSIITSEGAFVETNGRQFVEEQNPRSVARWKDAVEELVRNELLEKQGYRGETYRVTHKGYAIADGLRPRD